MTIESIDLWHTRARPQPTAEDFNVQLGCHLEEIVEMFSTLAFTYQAATEAGPALNHLRTLSEMLKGGQERAKIVDRKEFLDAIADQVVTGVGAAHCAHMDGAAAIERVNLSNWSKFDDEGMPIFNEHGKIAKGPKYAPPDLEGLY